mmetsp:Transcript_31161/g.87771  ORF Transcript_31161/g.87771 Transcript_31161/m.87771 type:complete len:353 (-) Transcript_31161:1341-2399(-)
MGRRVCAVPPFAFTSPTCRGVVGARPKGFLLNCTAHWFSGCSVKFPIIICTPMEPPRPRTTVAAIRRPRAPPCPAVCSVSTICMGRSGGGGASDPACLECVGGPPPSSSLLELPPPPSLPSSPDSSTYLPWPCFCISAMCFISPCTRAMFSRTSSASYSSDSAPSASRVPPLLGARKASGTSWYTDASVDMFATSVSRMRGCVANDSSVIVGRSLSTTCLAASGFLLSILQYMYPRSRRSGLVHSSVAVFSTRPTSSREALGHLRHSLTVAVSSCSCTMAGSSRNVSKKDSSKSLLLSIRSQYSPMIQIMEALASGSSRLSRFSQRSEMMISYLPGYFLKMSLITTIASWTT